MKQIFCFLFLAMVAYAYDVPRSLPRALEEQIEEDFSGIEAHSFTNRELFDWFSQCSDKNWQLVYCKIRNHQFEMIESHNKDINRHNYILVFMNELVRKYYLPDMDFVIHTADGFLHHSVYPLFTMAANQQAKKNVGLIPDHEALADAIHIDLILQYSQQHPWESKLNKGFFIGATTGIIDQDVEDCKNDRVRAVIFSSRYPDLLEANFYTIYQDCVEKCIARLPNKKITVPLLSFEQWLVHKYLLDIDGNCSTTMRGRSILISNSVLLKVTSNPASNSMQWYYKCLVPYVNYIPIKNDLSDLLEIFNWLQTHDREAHEIAMRGQELGIEIFSKASIESYVVHSLIAYAEKIRLVD